MKDLGWIRSELEDDGEPFASFRVVRTIVAPTRISTGRPLAAQAAGLPAGGDIRFDAAIRACLGSEVGLWFHAGWHDQAAFELFDSKRGTSRLTAHMLGKLDGPRPAENGDVILGFASTEADWVLLLRLSRERRLFRSEVRAATVAVADIVCGRIERDG